MAPQSTSLSPPRRCDRRAALALFAASGGGALAACQPGVNPFSRAAVAQVLRASLSDFATLDPIQVQGVHEAEYVVHVFSGLTALNEKLEVVPDLAEKWQVGSDGRTYTFTLRKGAKFHDGRDVKAADVKYSFERAADPAKGSPSAHTYLDDIAGAADRIDGKAAEIGGVRVKDDSTVEIALVEPRVTFLAKLAYPLAAVVDRANVESGGARWWTKPNGTGPFRLQQASRNGSLVLVRNDAYYGSKPTLTEAHFLPIQPALDGYDDGQLDVAEAEIRDIERVTDRSDPISRETHVRTEPELHYLAMNVMAKPFDDPLVRQAFNHALDRAKLADRTLAKTVGAAETIVPQGMPGHSDKIKGLEFDVSRARDLVASSSYRDAKNFPPIVLSVPGDRTPPTDIVVAIVSMYKQNLGVDVVVRQVSPDDFEAGLVRNKAGYQLFITGWVADYPDPQNFLEALFYSKSADNATLYANPDVDRQLERARTERDTAARLKLYQDAETQILKDAPIVPLWNPRTYVLVKPYVQGIGTPPPTFYPWLRLVSLKSNPTKPTLTQQG